MENTPVPEALVEWAFIALDHATGALCGSGGTLTPFVLSDDNHADSELRHITPDDTGGDYEKALGEARIVHAANPSALSAIGYLAHANVDGKYGEAVIVEARNRDGRTVILAQRYSHRDAAHPAQRIVLDDNPAIIG